MTIEAIPENQAAVERAWAVLETMNRGDILLHERLEDIFEVGREYHRYYELIKKLVRRMEEERGISLVCVFGAGYRLATTAEQLDLGAMRTRRAARQIRRGARSVGCLPDHGLSIHQQRKKAAIEDRMVQAEREMRQQAIWLAVLTKPREGNPRIHHDDELAAETA